MLVTHHSHCTSHEFVLVEVKIQVTKNCFLTLTKMVMGASERITKVGADMMEMV